MGDLAALGVGGPPVVPFVPTDVAGLVLWLRADDIAQADNTSVSAWADQSGSGNNAAAAGGVEPTLQTSEINGHSVVRFDGTNDVMSVAGITNNDATRTIFCVVKMITGTAGDGVWGWSNTLAAFEQSNTSGGIRYRQNSAAGLVALGSQTLGTAHIYALRYNSVSSADGYTDTGSATNFDPDDGFQSGAASLGIGARTAAGNSPGNFDLAEFLVYNSGIADALKDQVVNYAKAKYAF